MQPQLFVTRPASQAAYATLAATVSSVGPHRVEEKKTCLHLVGTKAAFLGVHPRREGLMLSIVLSRPVESSRIRKCERLSANRYHIEVPFPADTPVDPELRAWIEEAYRLSTPAV